MQYVTREDHEVQLDDILPPDSYEATVLRTWDYFKQIYPEDIAVEKGSLFMLMCSHISRKMDRYNRGNLAVDGSKETGALLSDSLMRAVHHYFTTRPIESLPDEDMIVDAIIDLAETKFREAK